MQKGRVYCGTNVLTEKLRPVPYSSAENLTNIQHFFNKLWFASPLAFGNKPVSESWFGPIWHFES